MITIEMIAVSVSIPFILKITPSQRGIRMCSQKCIGIGQRRMKEHQKQEKMSGLWVDGVEYSEEEFEEDYNWNIWKEEWVLQ